MTVGARRKGISENRTKTLNCEVVGLEAKEPYLGVSNPFHMLSTPRPPPKMTYVEAPSKANHTQVSSLMRRAPTTKLPRAAPVSMS